MPYEEFMEAFIKDQSKVAQNKLERIPQKDTVSFSGKLSDKDLNGDMNIETKDNLLGKRIINGTISGKQVEFVVKSGTFNTNVKLSGTIEGRPIELLLKGYKLSGDISDKDKDIVPHLRTIMTDKRNHDHIIAAS